MNKFRLAHWAELPEEFHQLKFRRAMTAMSAGFAEQHRLQNECGLSRKEMQALLGALSNAGALTVHTPGPAEGERARVLAGNWGNETANVVSALISHLRCRVKRDRRRAA